MFGIELPSVSNMNGLMLQVSLIRDTNTLGTLREMLVLIRLWGQTTPTVLPSITPSAGKIARPSCDEQHLHPCRRFEARLLAVDRTRVSGRNRA